MIEILDVVLFAFVAIIAVAVARLRSLFAAVMLTGIFSLISATLFVVMDAVDVAITEAAVGAGISTVLMLATLNLTADRETPPLRPAVIPFLIAVTTGAVFLYATVDMPDLGDPNAPIHRHVAPRYIEDSGREVGPPNIVTSVLASYRGYDTMGETTVIFTAAIGVLLLLGTRLRKRSAPGGKP